MAIAIELRNGMYVCPGCTQELAPEKCPSCDAGVPPNYCSRCGYWMAMAACLSCGQPQPGAVATAAAMDDRAGAPSELRSASVPFTFDVRDQGIVDAYASAEIVDSHGTLIDPEEVVRLALGALVDQMHDFRPIVDSTGAPAVRIDPNETVIVKKLIDGREVKLVKTRLHFDLAVDSARSAWQKVKDGVFKGLSIAFRTTADLAKKIADGVTNVIDHIESMPFISLVDEPSNGLALIESYRMRRAAEVEKPAADLPVEAPPEDPAAAATMALRAIREAPAEEPKDEAPPVDDAPAEGEPDPEPVETEAPAADPPPAEAAPPPAISDEQIAALEGRVRDAALAVLDARIATLRTEVFTYLTTEVAPTIDAARSAGTSSARETETRIMSAVTKQIEALRVAAPKRALNVEIDHAPSTVIPFPTFGRFEK